MIEQNVRAALEHYPLIAEHFIKQYSVFSRQTGTYRIHKKSSTEDLFREAVTVPQHRDDERAKNAYSFLMTLTHALKDEVSRHASGTLAKRKAEDLLNQVYERTLEEPFTNIDKIQEFQKKFFPKEESHVHETRRTTYRDRKLHKAIEKILNEVRLREKESQTRPILAEEVAKYQLALASLHDKVTDDPSLSSEFRSLKRRIKLLELSLIEEQITVKKEVSNPVPLDKTVSAEPLPMNPYEAARLLAPGFLRFCDLPDAQQLHRDLHIQGTYPAKALPQRLYHGTTLETAARLRENGFASRVFSDRNLELGAGTYFAFDKGCAFEAYAKDQHEGVLTCKIHRMAIKAALLEGNTAEILEKPLAVYFSKVRPYLQTVAARMPERSLFKDQRDEYEKILRHDLRNEFVKNLFQSLGYNAVMVHSPLMGTYMNIFEPTPDLVRVQSQ